ncbi:MAG: FAD-binding dehydrogenase [Planctomycetaceae bacterium]|nr:FAD-binding dehydrogenase [Planctomycetaceae bacterium]
MKTCDVIVVGAGGSGLAAGLAAAERGGQVLILEKRPQPGGTTGIAVGSFTAAETRLQRSRGIVDRVADHAVDAGKFADPEIERCNNDALRAYFLREAPRTFDWLCKLGLTFVGPNPEPPNRVPRMHNVVPGAKAYIAALQLALQTADATIICNATVEELLRCRTGICGVRAVVDGHSREYRARRGVVLAGGDYANDPEMIARYKGEQFREIEGINPFATGDGQRLAEQAGAELVNMEITYGPELRFVPAGNRPFQQWLPVGGMTAQLMGQVARRLPDWIMRRLIKRLLVTWQHPETALFEEGAILLNQHGRRFVDETAWPDREIGTALQPGKIAYILLDGRRMAQFSSWPHFISTAPDIAYAYVQDYRRLRPDITAIGNALDDVVQSRQLPLAAVRDTLAEYNRFARGDGADPCGRSKPTPSLDDGPWCLLGPAKAYFTTTEGGARVDQRLQVLDERGAPIPGLYAVGQNGLSGMVLFGHGLHIAWAMTSGRLAGEAIMDTAATGDLPASRPDPAIRPDV